MRRGRLSRVSVGAFMPLLGKAPAQPCQRPGLQRRPAVGLTMQVQMLAGQASSKFWWQS
jgi:hypothetical protein